MKAVVLIDYDSGPSVLEVEPVSLGSHEVRVQVGASGVCHSDLSLTRRQYPHLVLPLILGHEGAGVVVEVGSAVERVSVGDRVIASWRSSCGTCWQCVRGRQHLCETSVDQASRVIASLDGVDVRAHMGLGTMAECLTAHENNVVAVRTDLPDEQLALIGCAVTTGVGAALWTAGVHPGASVAVFGCGGVGLCVIQGAAIAGAAEIIAVDPSSSKRDAALSLGATRAIDPGASDPVEQIRAVTAGRGVEYAFEAVGSKGTIVQSYDAACRGGTVVLVGALPPDVLVEFRANALHADAKSILGSSYGSAQVLRDMPRLVKLIEAGRLNVESMVSRRLPLDGVMTAFQAISEGAGVRSVLVP